MEAETNTININKVVPNLRFREFKENWRVQKLGNLITSISSGKTKPEENGFFPVYGSTGTIGKSKKFTHDGEYILIARVGANAGKIQRINGRFSVTDNTLVLVSKEDVFLPSFAELFLLNYNLNKLIFGSGQPLITGGLIKAINFYLPSLPEQQKVASFLSAVDKKIQQLTRKKELLETYKKGVMQKLFSQEINFKDEDGKEFPEWKNHKGKDLFYSHSNKDHDGDLEVLAATQDQGIVARKKLGTQITSSEASVKSYKIVEPGDFVISLRSFQGGIEYSEVRGICSPAYIILKPKIKICDTFFKFFFKKESFIERLSKTVVGIRDGKQISYEAFSGLKMKIPSFEEQQKIADFLTVIDQKIEAVSQQIEKTQTFKKGLLQQMFV